MARYLLQPIDRLLVLDPKGSLGGKEWKLDPFTEKSAATIANGGTGRLRITGLAPGGWEAPLAWAEHCGGITVYIDEMYGVVSPGTKPSPALTALYTRGRERKIGVWAATQRPTWVPLFALSEAEWVFVFRLNVQEDRDRMAQFGGAVMKVNPRDKYGFYLYNTNWQRPFYSEGLRKDGSI